MNNIINFRNEETNHFEDLSLSARMIFIEETNREMEEHLDQLIRHAGELKALMNARKQHEQE